MALRAEDGTPLQPKEGVVLDREGNPVGPAPHERFRDPFQAGAAGQSRVFVVRGGGGLLAPLILVPAILLFTTIGLTILAAAAVIAIALWVMFTIRRILFYRR